MSEENNVSEKCEQPKIQPCRACSPLFCSTCEECPKCRNVSICHADEGGWFLKASRDLGPGETVFSECPLGVGPKIPSKNCCVPCVGCCRQPVIRFCFRSIFTENVTFCPKCLWPVCSLDCESIKNMSHAQECKILSKQNLNPSKTRFENYRFGILLPLKVLFTQTEERWDTLVKFLEEEDSLLQNEDLEYLADILTDNTIFQDKSLELLKKIFNYIKRNSLDVGEFQILFPSLGLLLHSCTPNTFTQTKTNEITLRARIPISAGTPITLSFTDVFQGTQERLNHLSSRNITCSCPRCSDPTEFGTFFSALKCLGTKTEPCGGTQLPKEPTKRGVWVCDKCMIELPNDPLTQFVQHLGSEVGKVLDKENTVEELEELLAKLLMFLHPNHFHVCRVKRALVKSYSHEMDTKIELCKNLINIFGNLYKGGVVLAELYHEFFVAMKNGEEALQVVEEMKKNVEAMVDEDFSKVVVEDENTLQNSLKNC